MATVCHPASGNVTASFAAVAKHYGVSVAICPPFPRHLGIHSGGMVLTERPVGEVLPIERARKEKRTVLQWDKDDCAWMGLTTPPTDRRSPLSLRSFVPF